MIIKDYSTRLTLILIAIFTLLGSISYLVIRDSFQQKLQADALILADLAVKQSEVFRRVYVRDVIGKLKEDGFGAHPHFLQKKGYIPISAQFVRMMSQEARNTFAEFQYKPVSKWNLGPYSIDNDDFLRWGWQQLEQQAGTTQREWKPVWKLVNYQDKPYLRYMSAITASSEKCIGCHRDFEKTAPIIERRKLQGIGPLPELHLGDLIGAMSVDIPLDNVQAFAKQELNKISIWLVMMLLITLVSVIFYTRHILKQRQNLQKMTWKAGHDKLTNLLNRRGFELALGRSIDDVDLGKKPFSICFIDLDGFKQVNDSHGHDAGDYVLKEVARILSTSVRNNDVTARLGGDEFIVLYEQCDAETACKLANTLLEKIGTNPMSWSGSEIHVGASIGIAEFRPQQHDAKILMTQADAACYKSKNSGKNQVTVFNSRLTQNSRS